MSAARPQFSIDDAFELSLEDAGPGPEASGVARFGPLHFERRARFEVADEDKQSRLRYQNLENDEDGAQISPEPDGGVSTRDSGRTSIRSSQWSFSTISSGTQRSYNTCCSWTQHPLIQKNRRVVLASFLLLLLGLVLILVGVGLEATPSPGVSSAIFFVPGFLLLVPGGGSGHRGGRGGAARRGGEGLRSGTEGGVVGRGGASALTGPAPQSIT
ncbi:transmembrane protein 134 isoform X4 [Theropithecus gelada]|uniref:transmembrane protein 134 isoform X4 n=1 Tax=Theropithecus gelada TaxID=9565 RepID=UPI000DC1B7F0|nr:transmembrane protein 134 isoform X4 [Theropithecus gelada]